MKSKVYQNDSNKGYALSKKSLSRRLKDVACCQGDLNVAFGKLW